MSSSSAQWEYGVYEVKTTYQEGQNPLTQTKWITREGETVAGAKSQLFRKLGAQEVMSDKHDIVLWNHLGEQGWHYVEQFDKTLTPAITQSQTIFRRELTH